MASGGVNLLDPQLFYELAAFHIRVSSFSQRYLRYNTFTETELLPLLSQGPEAFYHPRTDEMDPRFRVHMDQLRILRDEAVAIIDQVDLLVPRVQQEVERLR